jgi:hypothetical protein
MGAAPAPAAAQAAPVGRMAAAKGLLGKGLGIAGRAAPYAMAAWEAGDPEGSVLASRGLPSDHPGAPAGVGQRLMNGAMNIGNTLVAPFTHGIGTAANAAASVMGLNQPFDQRKLAQGDILGEMVSGGVGEGINAVARGFGANAPFDHEKLWPNFLSAEHAKARIVQNAQARQKEAANAAVAPHAGGDGNAVMHPDQQPGTPGAQPPPNPQPGSPQSGTPDYLLSDLRSNVGNTFDPQEHAEAMQSLTEYMHALSGGTTANAHMVNARAQGIEQYRDPGGLAMFGAANQLTPEQVGSIGSAMGHPAPGGAANRGYFESQYPQLRQPPGEEPRSADQQMRALAPLQQKMHPAVFAALRDSMLKREEAKATTQPSMINQLGNMFGFSDGMRGAQENQGLYDQIYGR